MDTQVGRRRDGFRYQVFNDGDTKILVPEDLAEYAKVLRVDVRTFLFLFRHIRAEIELYNGLRIGRGFPQLPN